MAYDGKRASFSGKMGFIFATAASAVGLGNLWRFPYEVSHNGGGIFVLIYLILAFTFGTCLMMMEIAYGRRTGKSGVAAFLEYSKKFRIIGYDTHTNHHGVLLLRDRRLGVEMVLRNVARQPFGIGRGR